MYFEFQLLLWWMYENSSIKYVMIRTEYFFLIQTRNWWPPVLCGQFSILPQVVA